MLELDQHIERGKTIPGGGKSKGKCLEVNSRENDLVGLEPSMCTGIKLESGVTYWR